MTTSDAVDLTREMVMVFLVVGSPLLITALVVGLVVSFLQAASQLHDATLSFIPKIVAVLLVLVVAGPWMLYRLTEFIENLWTNVFLFVP